MRVPATTKLPSLRNDILTSGFSEYEGHEVFSLEELNHLTDLFAAPPSGTPEAAAFAELMASSENESSCVQELNFPTLYECMDLPKMQHTEKLAITASCTNMTTTTIKQGNTKAFRPEAKKKTIIKIQQLSAPKVKKGLSQCFFDGCSNRARSKGLCKRHGGGKRCSYAGCDRPAQCKGRCPRHGGATRCKTTGCMKFSQSQGLCKSHGGGTLCAQDGCSKNAHQNRFCRQHGGGLKCNFSNCRKWAQKSGFCCLHTSQLTKPRSIAPTPSGQQILSFVK